MGQAWCKERTSKAQDSKSPLDRVFVRCAHRLYPGLKEEGSVLGGATQRVTSSEIGYAGSPPRHLLTRGESIDSVDRPFQPSDWVDVNLEVPSTPRPSSVFTNLTVDTSLYPAPTPPTSGSNTKDVTPIPPPRRKRRNRGRPLPPKPDEIVSESKIIIVGDLKRVDTSEDPLYTSLRPPNTTTREENSQDPIEKNQHPDKPMTRPRNHSGSSLLEIKGSKLEGRRTKEIFEHKMNGTGHVIPSDVVSGKYDLLQSKKQRTISLPNYDQLNGSFLEKTKSRNISLPMESFILKETNLRRSSVPQNSTADKVDGVEFPNVQLSKSSPIPEIVITKMKETSFPNDDNELNRNTSSQMDKPEGFGKTPTTISFDKDSNLEDWIVVRNRSSLFFEPPTMEQVLRSSKDVDDTMEDLPGNLIKTISEESLPKEMLEADDFFQDNKIINSKTPPPSPEPKIKAQILDNDHSVLLRILRDETTTAEESNLSSMTPSLTELEVALSDMLEKEDHEDETKKAEDKQLIEPEIVPVDDSSKNPFKIEIINQKNCLNPFKDNSLVEVDVEKEQTLLTEELMVEPFWTSNQTVPFYDWKEPRKILLTDEAPEKPTRLFKINPEDFEKIDNVPTPPRRKRRSYSNLQSYTTSGDPLKDHIYSNDRLI